MPPVGTTPKSVTLWSAPASPLAGNRKPGRAMSVTPARAITPADASLTVKGSCHGSALISDQERGKRCHLTPKASQHTNDVIVGTRNVMTVASETSRYDSESAPVD